MNINVSANNKEIVGYMPKQMMDAVNTEGGRGQCQRLNTITEVE